MKQYTDLVSRILGTGELREDRTGVGTLSVFGGHMTFDLRQRFPLVTVKETRWRTAFLEMLWFLRGEGTTKFLHKHNCKLWDAWADGAGYLGPVYGVQWRKWMSSDGDMLDQIHGLIHDLKTNPQSRRHIVTAWNPVEIDDMALPPCHWAFQCYVSGDGHLDMQVHQRSWDAALGAPFNIAQYALLLTLLARATGLQARRLMFAYGDAHIYLNHIEAMRDVITRQLFDRAPTRLLVSTDNVDIDRYRPEDFDIAGYAHHPHIKLEIAV